MTQCESAKDGNKDLLWIQYTHTYVEIVHRSAIVKLYILHAIKIVYAS